LVAVVLLSRLDVPALQAPRDAELREQEA